MFYFTCSHGLMSAVTSFFSRRKFDAVTGTLPHYIHNIRRYLLIFTMCHLLCH